MMRLAERIEKYTDPHAMLSMAMFPREGQNGLLVDQSKAFELLQRACELGSAGAHCNLGIMYRNGEGVERNTKKAVHHWQIAAMTGSMFARHNLGIVEAGNGNIQRSLKHFMIAARCGYQESLDNVKQGFRDGFVTKEEFEKTLRDYQAVYEETRSEQRDRAAVIIARAEERKLGQQTPSQR
eukprot:scaffold83626_cov28-Cyclotella_meneghiniana.AAC.2